MTRKNKIWAWRASDLLKDFSSDAQKDFSWVFHGCEMSWALVSLIQAIGHAHEPSRAALLHHPYLPLSYQRKPEFFQCHLLKANNPMSFRSTHPLNEQGKKHHKEWCGFWSGPKTAGIEMDRGRAFHQSGGNHLLENRRKCCQARREHFSSSHTPTPTSLILTSFPYPGCLSTSVPLKRNRKSDALHCWRELWSYCPSVIISAFVRANAKVNWDLLIVL